MATAPSASGTVDEIPAVLIVDDDQSICRMLVRALGKDRGLRLEAAADAREARAWLERERFDLVITDIMMPGEDGISLMQWGRDAHPDVSWIVLTGRGTLDAAVRSLQLGAFDFIEKPLRLATLRNAVENALNQRSLRAERDRLYRELEESNRQLREHVNDLEVACTLLREQATTIEADLRRAALIQRALLPQTPPVTPGLSVNVVYRLSYTVGGDLYDVVRLNARYLVLMVADAAGHGLSAAMLAVLFRSRLPMLDLDTDEPRRPSEVLSAANAALMFDLSAPGLFLTAAYCLVDMVDLTCTVASAGHPPVILQRTSGNFERLFHTGPALGLYADARFTERQMALYPGDRLVLHTDGLTERLSRDERSSSETVFRYLERLQPDASSPSEAQALRSLLNRDEALADQSALLDDLTVMSLRVEQAESTFDNGDALPMAPVVGRVVDDGCEILVGSESRRVILSIRGRATWVHSAAFYQTCVEALEVGRDVIVDLALCQQLDSTLLGTLHELALRADDAHLEFRLQGVLPPIHELFSELGMSLIMDHIVGLMLPLPTEMSVVVGVDEDVHSKWMRMLRAHESLASLNERSRVQFDPLLEVLRKEVACLGR